MILRNFMKVPNTITTTTMTMIIFHPFLFSNSNNSNNSRIHILNRRRHYRHYLVIDFLQDQKRVRDGFLLLFCFVMSRGASMFFFSF